MADLLFLVIVIAFFVSSAGLVAVCDRLIGPDETASAPAETAGERVAVGAR